MAIPRAPSEDGQMVFKRGPWQSIQWEWVVYSRLQRLGRSPEICERLLDYGPDSTEHGLVLRYVGVFEELFTDKVPSVKQQQLPFSLTAWAAVRLITTMKYMHASRVLHCDIHPGNIGFPLCHNLQELLSALCQDTEEVYPTFIDFEWARMQGWHPLLPLQRQAATWTYQSDRAVRDEPYCAADDFESLAYSLIAFRLLAAPPWHEDSYDAYYPPSEDRDTFLATRASRLRDLRTKREVEEELLDMVDYARSLQPGDPIDYAQWVGRLSKFAADVRSDVSTLV
ncbi:kinase-like domain-containing protein [Fomitopsis serialis]|uniref:kinase-like domain-containing protein n=1 Tax=Fomitopsis serialis TaxID=139415 RepID=UPI002008DBEE|nr:kinase-like domain-containing protein [Neoantrodia serialis]KAH9914930.1 kinase-like domain-containing protein [Neoantrodia serialis]